MGTQSARERDVLGSNLRSDSGIISIFHYKLLSNSHGVWICGQLTAVGSPRITLDLNVADEM